MKARRGGRIAVLLILLAILVHLGAWTFWFALAGRHPVADVPLATARH